MQRRSFIKTSSAALLGAGSASAETLVSDWQLTWADEFNGPTINTSNQTGWDVLTQVNNFNQEKQVYLPEMAAITQTDNRSVLRITSTRSWLAIALRVSPSMMSSRRVWAPRSSRSRWK